MASRWPIEDVALEELSLDLHNVRIPVRDLDEQAIASYLVEAANLLELARDILRDGYIDNELPVVVDENGRQVVLEGNRRIAALKASHDPPLLGRFAPRMERLLSRYPEADIPTGVRVMISPSRQAAEPLLARLHTRNPKESWLREQQAVFYHSQLSRMSVSELRTRFPDSASLITRFIRMGEMREVIRGLRYSDRDLEQFVRSSQLKMTSFEYAYARPKIQDALGLKFNEDGLLVSKRMSAGQCRGLVYLLEEFKAGTLNTRSPELRVKSSEHDRFVEQLRRMVAGEADATAPSERDDASAGPGQPGGSPATSHNGVGTGNATRSHGGSRDGGGGTGPGSSATGPSGGAQAGSRGPKRGETRLRLDMGGFVYQGSSAGVRRRFEELRHLDVREFPNAAHDLLRTVLECAIKDHFAAKGQPLAGKMLGACMGELARTYESDRRMTALINVVNRKGRMPAQQFAGTASSLNASNHEPDSFVTGPDVHEAWERIKPILIEIVGW